MYNEIPKRYLPEYELYQERIVGFIDILGFNQMIKAIKNRSDFFKVAKLLYACKYMTDGFNKDKGLFKDFIFTAFSDSVVISVNYAGPIGILALLQILHQMQYELIATDFKTLLRGFINKGFVYHKDGIIFGPGYSCAYAGERIIGGAPRIVVSPHIIDDVREKIESYPDTDNSETIFDFLLEDKSDGYYFIDYLKPIGRQSDLPKIQLEKERQSIQDFIEQSIELHRDNYIVCAKYKWLKNYCYSSSFYFG